MSRYLTCKELLILEMQEKRDGKTVLRVVQWGKNKPKLEKRRFYLQDGELKTGKLEGLSSEDLKLIMEKHDEIQTTLIGNKQPAESNNATTEE
ncbi:hypothetical protein ACFL5I_00680 [Planctomycetota bacterium]